MAEGQTRDLSMTLDFTNVKDGGGGLFNKKRITAGDYQAVIQKVQKVKRKSGDHAGEPQWLFTIEVDPKTGPHGKGNPQKLPYYCTFDENQLWKIRNLFVAAGQSVPKKRAKLDPTKVLDKIIGVTVEDDEYNDKPQSSISATFPPSELEATEDGDEDEEEEGEAEDAEGDADDEDLDIDDM